MHFWVNLLKLEDEIEKTKVFFSPSPHTQTRRDWSSARSPRFPPPSSSYALERALYTRRLSVLPSFLLSLSSGVTRTAAAPLSPSRRPTPPNPPPVISAVPHHLCLAPAATCRSNFVPNFHTFTPTVAANTDGHWPEVRGARW
jgi:hypothetical protein